MTRKVQLINDTTMKIRNKILVTLLAAGLSASAFAQQKVTGTVLNAQNKPIENAVITSAGCKTVRSAADGSFTIEGVKDNGTINVWSAGYFSQTQNIKGADVSNLKVLLIDSKLTRYNETTVLPWGIVDDKDVAGVDNVNVKDFGEGAISIDNAMKQGFTGLQVKTKSGMTGEGAYMQLRGVNSLAAETNPLIVINGVPYMPDQNLSDIIGGYSRGIFQSLNIQDIRNITVLKGAEAAAYGSLGGNGVIMIETQQATSDDMNTRISFSAIAGMNFNNSRIPLMNAAQYKSYLSDMGLSYYGNQEQFFKDFTFLSDPEANQSYLYQYDTNYQDEIMRNSSTMDYLFRVEGGDNIAKYNISLGYLGDNGTMKNTHTDRYNAQINASVLVSKKVEILTSINTAYLTGQYQEQGMSRETSPLLTSYRRSPLLSPMASDMYGNLISRYSSYYYGAIKNSDFIASNPLAIVNTLNTKNRQYDLNAKLQLIYRPIQNLTLSGTVGMYYNYNQEEAFIPGIDNNDIAPLFDQYGQADNSVRVGTNHTFNMYFGLDATYNLKINELNKVMFNLGWQSVIDSYEYDAAFGRNSANDFYQTMGDAQSLGKYFSGYNNKWNWMGFHARAAYTWASFFKAGVTASVDGSSAIGKDVARMNFYPAVDLTFMLKELSLLKNVDLINKLDVYANYAITGNSRFSSKFGKYYYTSQPFMTIAGIIRNNIPNTTLKAEQDNTLNVGIEASLLRNRLQFGVNYFDTDARDVLINTVHTSVLGTSPYYNNDGSIKSRGFEISASGSPIQTNDFRWTLGGTLSTLKNEVKSLGQVSQNITTLSDGAEIITRVGENPYSFYGYKALGVFSTTQEAEAANLQSRSGVKYQAGDVHYQDINKDGIINDDDKVILGSATPDFFGSFFTRFEYKGFALDATFTYSQGNEAYNAVRRITESGKDFSNQSTSLVRRWSMEGQQTDIPRVSYGDAVGNNDFSSRWIEDASFLKLANITFSYNWTKPLWKFIQSGTAFISADNLLCFSSYLGLDPEFSFSYSPVMQGVDYGKLNAPKSVKIGVNLKF